MLQSLLAGLSVTPEDVQVWDCNPLLIIVNGDEVAYAQETKIEFTPFVDNSEVIGHAIALEEAGPGVRPEISISTRQYIDNPIEMARRQGIKLMGVDPMGNGVEWLINGAADRYLTSPEVDQIPYDEETARLLEEELAGNPDKLNLNSYL